MTYHACVPHASCFCPTAPPRRFRPRCDELKFRFPMVMLHLSRSDLINVMIGAHTKLKHDMNCFETWQQTRSVASTLKGQNVRILQKSPCKRGFSTARWPWGFVKSQKHIKATIFVLKPHQSTKPHQEIKCFEPVRWMLRRARTKCPAQAFHCCYFHTCDLNPGMQKSHTWALAFVPPTPHKYIYIYIHIYCIYISISVYRAVSQNWYPKSPHCNASFW